MADAGHNATAHIGRALEAAGVGTWRYDLETHTLTCSTVAVRLYRSDGCCDENCAQSMLNAIHPDDRDAVVTAGKRLVAGETPRMELEHRVVDDVGTVRWVEIIATLHREDGHTEIDGTIRDVSEHRATRDALRASEARYRQLVTSAPEALLVLDAESLDVVDVNPSAERLFGRSRRRLLERSALELSTDNQPDLLPSASVLRERFTGIRGLAGVPFDWTFAGADGRELVCEIALSRVELNGRRCLRCTVFDVTDRRRLQAVFDQRSRLEALGRLAGGVAHDFNNLLTAIRGHASLAHKRPPEDPKLRHDLESIERAALRAGELTRQLLVFARQSRVRPLPINPNPQIQDALDLLRPLVPPNVRLKLRLEDRLWPVSIDPTQFEQVIVNLVLNARDAVGERGRITVRTGNLGLGEEDTGYAPGVPTGEWVVLSVADNGEGMTPEVLDHVFEPFFSTKSDQGTGLGLATCHGIVQQAGGRLIAQSEAGMGSIFRVFLPRAATTEVPAPQPHVEPSPRQPPVGAGTILVVEDESMVREVAVSALQAAGYHVLEASDAEAAIATARRHGPAVDLLVTDVIMPGLSGPQLAQRLHAEHPELPVLYVSGYADHQTSHVDGEHSPKGEFLAKPYTPEQLARRVGALLRGRGRGPGPGHAPRNAAP